MSRSLLATSVLVVTALAAGGAYYWLRVVRAAAAVSAPPPTTVKPEMREVETTITATGTIRLRTGAEVRVGAQISGIVTRLNVTVGSHINKDDVIAEIDSRGLDSRIAQAKAQIAIDRAALQKLDLQMSRTRKLLEEELIARQAAEELEEDVKSAQSKLNKSLADLAVVESDTPYLTIRAPITGTVASVSTQQGETIAASFNAPTFVTIIEDNALELVAMVDETDIAGVRASNGVTFTTETYPTRDFHGTVERIAPRATITSGVVNYEVGVKLRDGGALLKPDMTANATIQTARRKGLSVPNDAVRGDAQERFLYVALNGAVLKRSVLVGQRAAGWTEIKKGINVDDRVLMGQIQTSQVPQGVAQK